MSIVDSLAVKPLLVVVAVLALALGGAGLRIYKLQADVESAQAAQHTAETDLVQWKKSTADAVKAGAGWKAVAARRAQLLADAQAENTRLNGANAEGRGQGDAGPEAGRA